MSAVFECPKCKTTVRVDKPEDGHICVKCGRNTKDFCEYCGTKLLSTGECPALGCNKEVGDVVETVEIQSVERKLRMASNLREICLEFNVIRVILDYVQDGTCHFKVRPNVEFHRDGKLIRSCNVWFAVASGEGFELVHNHCVEIEADMYRALRFDLKKQVSFAGGIVSRVFSNRDISDLARCDDDDVKCKLRVMSIYEESDVNESLVDVIRACKPEQVVELLRSIEGSRVQ